MSTTLKLRGGTTAQHSTFTGEAREVTVDTQKNTVVVHDGSTAGGHPVANQADITAAKARANHTGTQPHTTVTGLGTAATSDVTTSSTDTTAGRLLKVGDFGVGSAAPTTGFDGTTGSRFLRASEGGPLGNTAVGGVQAGVTGTIATQFAGRLGRFFARSYGESGNVWRELYHNGNVVGTVSQSGGVPTGAIIQSGSNANGEFVRYADGTQICTFSNITFAISGSFVEVVWTFPALFAGSCTALVAPNRTGSQGGNTAAKYTLGVYSQTDSKVNITATLLEGATTTATTWSNNRVTAIGRWY